MEKSILGIYHITAIASEPQRNIDFYTGVLGLRLVKRTVNFDDPGTYHFYYGDQTGSPGTILTFFPWPGAPKGRPGTGQVTVLSFSIPEGSLAFWTERLDSGGLNREAQLEGFDERTLSFSDPDGISIDLVEEQATGAGAGWPAGPVPAEHAIRGFHSATISVEGYERTEKLLTETLGFRPTLTAGNRRRFESGEGGPGSFLDVLCVPDSRPGTGGTGTVHHIAWRTPSDTEQAAWQWKVAHGGMNVTPIIDREYFRSIYFREPGGVLFEIATDTPGFMVDEPEEELGRRLCLPPQFEASRQQIEQALPPLNLPAAGPETR